MNNSISHFKAGEDAIMRIETSLARVLKPVTPNPDFVRQLGRRIVNPPAITLERRPELKAIAFLAFALFSGIFLVWLLILIGRYFSGGKNGEEAG